MGFGYPKPQPLCKLSMKLIKIQLTTIVTLLSGFANAGWHEDKVQTIHTYLHGGVSVYTETNHECGSSRISFDINEPGFQRIYSSILAYEAQGKKIRFTIQSCNGTIGVSDRIVSIN